jgi:hypothetical protein
MADMEAELVKWVVRVGCPQVATILAMLKLSSGLIRERAVGAKSLRGKLERGIACGQNTGRHK